MGNLLATDLDHILTHTAEMWDELRQARIFLTGATGFFGCWLLESFSWAHARLGLNTTIVALTRSPEAFRLKAPHLASYPAIHLVQGDVRSFDFPAGRFTHVIHAATEASASLNREQPLVMLDTIVEGTRRALEFAIAAGAARFLLTSSGAVYGVQPPAITHLPESFAGGPDPTNPNSVYGEGKRLAELLCAVYEKQTGLRCLIPRYFAFVGPYLPLNSHFAIGNFIGDCMRGNEIEIRGDGTPYRSYLYAADLAIWTWTILVRGQGCRPYNVGSERDLTIAALAETVRDALTAAVDIRIMGVPSTNTLPERYVPATGRTKRELRLKEWIPLEDAIRRTAAWNQNISMNGALEAEG